MARRAGEGDARGGTSGKSATPAPCVRAAPTASMDRPWTNCTRCASSSASSRSTASPRPPTRWACRAPR
ncbi:hypothetical protein D9621_27935 (plasmid) [Azospirillum brasilense]|nr:hypothetical protein D9621_27935 [Azospirillum brasilense]